MMDTSRSLAPGQWRTLVTALRLRSDEMYAQLIGPKKVSKRERGELSECILALRAYADAIERGELQLGAITSEVQVTTYVTLTDATGANVGTFDVISREERHDFGSLAAIHDSDEGPPTPEEVGVGDFLRNVELG